ncbi:uncharacterized protein LOC111276608 isoform X2 [Durio zibethinus]|uniref:Uncharacterized protein LOC111276608 isoform X2 n=1 Tax=Durio zibethinus TaxID=66656 RepID=A0A6P5WRE6_DURZI|nr:uncharacterized protein LOC111276608 isoform X2 [Durio zibethinus]
MVYTAGGKKKNDSALAAALPKRKSSKMKKQRKEMQEGFKRLKEEMEDISKEISSSITPKKGSSSWLEFGAEVEKLEEEVAVKRAETRLLAQQLMEAETKVEASQKKANELRMLNALLFLENQREQSLVNDLTRRFLG